MNDIALLTDSYQLAMTQAYLDHGLTGTAVFEFFARRLPPDRAFLIAAGLEQVLEYLESLRFGPEEIDWLRSTGRYRGNLLSYLESFRFTGQVLAMPEATPFFPNEPILRIEAPLPQAQLVETRTINLLQFQTLIASKAARCVLAAGGKTLVDFGLRRAHGAEAGLLAARAAYLAGFDGTSNVLAERLFGIPVFGTMAHSFVEAQEDEISAFERFARSNPDNVTLLIDTYDTEEAAKKLEPLAASLRSQGIRLQGVRLDSGDLGRHARQVRKILDDSGLDEVKIFASGNLDEFSIHELVTTGAPVDGFGVGTSLVTSEDAPYLDCAYKLEQYAGIPRQKLSEGKATLPGPKQVFRQYASDGRIWLDVVALENERHPGSPLLKTVMHGGKRLFTAAPLDGLRSQCLSNLERLPLSHLSLINSDRPHPVRISERLQALSRELRSGFAARLRVMAANLLHSQGS